MLSLYEILKASKTGIAPDMWTALAGANFGGAGSGAEVKELTGILPLSFTADGTPLLDYLISGNMEQSGTPTLTNPIQPQECGERTGNLFDKTATNTNNGYIPNGYVRADGTENTNRDYRASEYISVDASTAYTLYCVVALNAPSVCFYDSDKNFISGVPYSGHVTVPFTTPQNAAFLRLSYRAIDEDAIMLNTGSTALPYEPYGYKLDISSANTTTPIYLGEVPTTRRIKKLVLTGEETSWQSASASEGRNRFTLPILNAMQADTAHFTSLSTHLPLGVEGATWNTDDIYTIASSKLYMRLTAQYNTLADFKSYLSAQYAAGTPVTIWYVLAEPTTGIVNEPLRKIGDYADTLSMEQAGVQIPTLHGNTVIDVDTTLKPSEMYIKYQG